MLSVENLSKYYYHKALFKNISFTIRNGDCVALMGKNGAGKTTLLKILAGLIIADDGKVLYRSKSLSVINPNSRKDFLYLGHHPGFYSAFTGVENLVFCASLYGLNPTQGNIEDILENSGLEHAKKKPVQFYSQGMIQRLKIALALLIPWNLLLFDEPLNGLDKSGTSYFEAHIQNWIKKGRTILLVHHSNEWVKTHCSWYIGLDETHVKLNPVGKLNVHV
jgi:ABC-2 type transport system ATP-binding protein